MHTDQEEGENQDMGTATGRKSTDRNDGSRRRLCADKQKGRLKGLGAWEFSLGFKKQVGAM